MGSHAMSIDGVIVLPCSQGCSACLWDVRLANLASKLRMVGALELAFNIAWEGRMRESYDGKVVWHSGCHRTAPGWARGEGEK